MSDRSAPFPIIDAPNEVLTPERLAEIARDVEPGTHMRIPGLVMPHEWQQIRKIKQGTWFLIRNDGATTGERFSCKHHKLSGGPVFGAIGVPVYHPFLTVSCIPAPFRGLDTGLIKYVQVSSNPEARRRLSRYIPELADTQPELARTLRPERGDDFYAFVVGLAEPITPQQARGYVEEIYVRTGRHPRVRVRLAA